MPTEIIHPNPAIDKRAAVEAIRTEFESSRGSRIWKDYVIPDKKEHHGTHYQEQ